MRKVFRFVSTNEEVLNILEQVPKGVMSLYIEQAIIGFSKNSPKIEFFFKGITREKRRGRKPKQDKNSLEMTEKSVVEEPTKENVKEDIKDNSFFYTPKKNLEKQENNSSTMMFDFGK